MAPVSTKPHKANGHKRYLPEKTDTTPKLPHDVDLEESTNEAGALQPVSEPKDTAWEGFGDEKQTDNSGDEDEGDADSMQLELEKQKLEKPILPKDAEEEELERIIFGDSAGFKQGLEDFSLDRTSGAYGDSSDEALGEDADLEGVADQDLFFFDAGPVAAPAGSIAAGKTEDSESEGDKPAWEDSDDERLVVSLASVPQLRKLRETVDDDMVNGKDYSRRLRKQYERLYPSPEWALHATGKAKKRRRTMDEDESEEGSASEMDMDEENLSSQPLARLLKDADILSRNTRGPVKRRKLQAGTVDIQRLKDVTKAGPVSEILPNVRYASLTSDSVCDYFVIFPPDLSPTPLLRAELDSVPAPRAAQPAKSQSPPDLPPHQAHTTHYDCLPSVRLRFAHIFERPSPLFPHLEHRYWQGGEGLAHLWPPT
jgi:U3 small nucleolar RNA-associated protein 18